MNRQEALLTQCIVESWQDGFSQVLFRQCSLPSVAVDINRNVRLRATDIAWREFDLLTDVFYLSNIPVMS